MADDKPWYRNGAILVPAFVSILVALIAAYASIFGVVYGAGKAAGATEQNPTPAAVKHDSSPSTSDPQPPAGPTAADGPPPGSGDSTHGTVNAFISSSTGTLDTFGTDFSADKEITLVFTTSTGAIVASTETSAVDGTYAVNLRIPCLPPADYYLAATGAESDVQAEAVLHVPARTC